LSINFKSKFEARVYSLIPDDLRGSVVYEPKDGKLDYVLPASKYNPDFVLPNGIHVETKGKLTPEDRRKMIAVKAHNPDKDIRFVFMRARNTLNKSSKTSYAEWADRNGFPWAEGSIPESWFEE
jgi:hypothetical protein